MYLKSRLVTLKCSQVATFGGIIYYILVPFITYFKVTAKINGLQREYHPWRNKWFYTFLYSTGPSASSLNVGEHSKTHFRPVHKHTHTHTILLQTTAKHHHISPHSATFTPNMLRVGKEEQPISDDPIF